MSGLMGIVYGNVQPGVYVVADVTFDATSSDHATAADQGWSLAQFTGGSDRATVLAGIAKALSFPSYFGGNLDALVDCLRDVDVHTVLLWRDWADLDHDSLTAIVEILQERAAIDPLFAVLLCGPGPDLGLPTLS